MNFSLLITLLVSLLAAGSAAFAQTSVATLTATNDIAPQTQTNVTNVIPEQRKENTFSLTAAIEYSQKTAVDERGARESRTDMTLEPAYQINKSLNASVKSIITKENFSGSQTLLSNTILLLGIKGFNLYCFFSSGTKIANLVCNFLKGNSHEKTEKTVYA